MWSVLPRSSWLLLVAGCAPPGPLVDTPIVGGSAEVRAAITAELAAFDAATGGGRTRVSRVTVRDLDGIAQFEQITNAVAVDDALSPADARVAVRHELCHALDDVEDVSADPRYAVLGAALAATGAPLHHVPWHREAMAAFCTLGPDAAQLVRRACPGEDPTASAAFADLWDRVWVDAPWRPVAAPGPTWATVAGGRSPTDVRALAAGDGAVLLAWTDQGEPRNGLFDLHTGGRVDEVPPWSAQPGPVASDASLPDAPLHAAGVGGDGRVAVLVNVPLYTLGTAQRLMVGDGKSWALLGDGCADGPPFVADGAVFTIRVDAGQIGWGPATP